MRRSLTLALVAFFLTLTGCGGGGSDSAQTGRVSNALVGGVVIGAAGPLGVVLNGEEAIELEGNGEFVFSTELSTGDQYSIELSSVPQGQLCTLAGETGEVQLEHVDTVLVTCADIDYPVGGNVSGLSGTLTIVLNDLEEISINENGEFSFDSLLNFGDTFSVAISQLPELQVCAIANNSGQVDVDLSVGVAIECSTSLNEPLVSNISPAVFRTGQEVKISGANLEHVEASYGGQELVFSHQLDNELRFIAPERTGGQSILTLENAAGVSEQTLNHGLLTEGIQNISAGHSHSCAVKSNGEIICWGSNRYGALGDGTEINSRSPVVVEGIGTAIKVSAGGDHSCAVLESGHVQCWGFNPYGQLGNGNENSSNVPVTVLGVDSAISVTSGEEFSCALLSSGGVECWGYNGLGQLGNGNVDSNVPQAVFDFEEGELLSNVVELSSGNFHTCARLVTGSVKCWGFNSSGQLGNGSSVSRSSPVTVQGIESAVKVGSGLYHSCAVLSSGSVQCWGDNDYGQLGNGLDQDSNIPVSVDEISNATSVDGSFSSSCALLVSGDLKCWGGNSLGNLGDGTNESSYSPVNVAGLSSIQSLSLGSNHGCALSEGGSISCWGNNSSGQRGDGVDTSYMATPFTLSDIDSASSVSVGYEHICANLSDGLVTCWGNNSSGQVGLNGPGIQTHPILVDGITNVTNVASGGSVDSSHSCAVTSEGSVYCWGENNYGQLGNGTNESSSTPQRVSSITNAIAVSASHLFSCALLGNGQVRCWGYNGYGRLGNGDTVHSNVPVSVSGIESANAIATGGSQSCALLESGEVQCWGRDSSGIPAQIDELANVIAIASGGNHSCALVATGSVTCWGENRSGQLGDGSTTYSSTPVVVSDIDSATSISAGHDHTCARLSTGQIKCWGSNSLGKLGDGSRESSSIPVLVHGIDSAMDVSLGYESSCAKLGNGKVQCWGGNSSDQLTISNLARTASDVIELNYD